MRHASAFVLAAVATLGIAHAQEKRSTWTDADLVAGYTTLAAEGALDRAIRSPALPKDPPQPAFLSALAWFAAETPVRSGTLTLVQLERFLDGQVAVYRELLQAKVQQGAANDYPRTRTWKVIQKLTVLRDEMTRHDGRYAYDALPPASPANDPWERAHTLTSPEEFAQKVCGAPKGRPVLVKFGNTNCTQCMLFELTGSVKAYADAAAARGPLDVYKVWFGLQPDGSFTGRIRDPKRLDDLAKAEGVTSSPTFVVYRDGRRITCGDAFPDVKGGEARLDACLAKDAASAPVATACAKAAN